MTLPAIGARAAAPAPPTAYRFDGGGHDHAPLPYLPVQVDRWDCASVANQCASPRNRDWRWRVELPANQVSRSLEGLGVGAVHGIQVTQFDGADRVRTAKVSGGRGAVTVRGRDPGAAAGPEVTPVQGHGTPIAEAG